MVQLYEQTKLRIADLKAASYNARMITDWRMRKLMRSIETNGFLDPIVVNKDMTIIGGHQRIEAMKNIGEEFVMGIVLDLDKKAERDLNIQLNRVFAEDDEEMLAELVADMTEAERLRAGLDENECKKMLNEAMETIDLSGADVPQETLDEKCPACGRKMPKGKSKPEEI